MNPYQINDDIIINLDTLADASWRSDQDGQRRLHIRLAAQDSRPDAYGNRLVGLVHWILAGDDAERFWAELRRRQAGLGAELTRDPADLHLAARMLVGNVQSFFPTYNPDRAAVRLDDFDALKAALDRLDRASADGKGPMP
jgi:hypothetical protein